MMNRARILKPGNLKHFSQNLATNNYCNIYIISLKIIDESFHNEMFLNRFVKHMPMIFSKDPKDDKYPYVSPPFIHTDDYFADKYVKEVLSCLINQKLLQSDEIMPEAKQKAKTYLKIKNFSVGAYSESAGLLQVRRDLAKWYEERDEGYKIDEDSMMLVNGGNNCYDHAMNLICNSGDSILVPNPCYPLFLNYNEGNKLENLYYNLNRNGKIDIKQLEKTVTQERAKGKTIKAILILNPHYPLGTILNREDMEEIINFCTKNHLVIVASEKLQNSIYPTADGKSIKMSTKVNTHLSDINLQDSEGNKIFNSAGKKFYSFRYMVNKLNSKQELFSFYSISNAPFFK
jgi:aspartate/methionine/tyrosine aminotransferase